MLHEIAHELTWRIGEGGHGTLWKQVFIDLVEWHISPNKAAELRWAWHKTIKRGVKNI
jgi:hypothetical protein